MHIYSEQNVIQAQCVEASKGFNKTRFLVTQPHINVFGTLYGGIAAVALDVISSFATVEETHSDERLSDRDGLRAIIGYSFQLDMTYLSPLKLHDELIFETRVQEIDKVNQLTTLKCLVSNAKTGKLVLVGRHSKVFG